MLENENEIKSILDSIEAQYQAGLFHTFEYRRSLRTISNMVNERLDAIADKELCEWNNDNKRRARIRTRASNALKRIKAKRKAQLLT